MKQVKFINFLLYSSLILIISMIIFACIFIALLATPNDVGSPFTHSSEDPTYQKVWLTFTILLIISVLLAWIFEIVNGILILSTKWDTRIIPEKSIKTMWGVFTIIPLGLIGSLIFAIIAKNNAKKYIKQHNC